MFFRVYKTARCHIAVPPDERLVLRFDTNTMTVVKSIGGAAVPDDVTNTLLDKVKAHVATLLSAVPVKEEKDEKKDDEPAAKPKAKAKAKAKPAQRHCKWCDG